MQHAPPVQQSALREVALAVPTKAITLQGSTIDISSESSFTVFDLISARGMGRAGAIKRRRIAAAAQEVVAPAESSSWSGEIRSRSSGEKIRLIPVTAASPKASAQAGQQGEPCGLTGPDF